MRNKALYAAVAMAVLGACSPKNDAPAPNAAAAGPDAKAVATGTPAVGQVEIVAELDITPGNVTATKDGRIFASIHGMRRGPVQLIEVTGPKTRASRRT